jgi:hypothetical protein
MDDRQLRFLSSAFTNDSNCVIVRRPWGGLWVADDTTVKGMEPQGMLRFEWGVCGRRCSTRS